MAFMLPIGAGAAALGGGLSGLSTAAGGIMGASTLAEGATAALGGLSALGGAAQGASMLYGGGKEALGSANRLVHGAKKGFQNAKSYIQGLTKKGGMKKFITKDLGRFAGQASDYIASGEGLKHITTAANTTAQLGNMLNDVSGGKFSQYNDKLQHAVGMASGEAIRYHDVLDQYNNTGRNLAKGIKDTINSVRNPTVQNV